MPSPGARARNDMIQTRSAKGAVNKNKECATRQIVLTHARHAPKHKRQRVRQDRSIWVRAQLIESSRTDPTHLAYCTHPTHNTCFFNAQTNANYDSTVCGCRGCRVVNRLRRTCEQEHPIRTSMPSTSTIFVYINQQLHLIVLTSRLASSSSLNCRSFSRSSSLTRYSALSLPSAISSALAPSA